MVKNLQLIENQPRWRVAVLHHVAKLIGVWFKVEGIPFGSMRAVRFPRGSDTTASTDSTVSQ